MGYCSDVALTLRKENAVEMVRKAKIECESAYKTLSAAKIVDHDEYVSFLWYSIKWYHFDDVVFITNFCHECDDYSLKRIGEEDSDIDGEMGGEDYDMADCCMIVRDFEIGSNKGGLTIDKLAQEEHQMTDNEHISALQMLIDSAISVGRDWLWNDSDIMDTLTDENGFGLTYDEFVMAGFKEMADEYFH